MNVYCNTFLCGNKQGCDLCFNCKDHCECIERKK